MLDAATEKSQRTLKVPPNGKAVGIDFSTQMIKLAQKIFTRKIFLNLSFQVMDARKLAFQNEFDIVFSNAALHWIADQKSSVLLGVQRSLKPGEGSCFKWVEKATTKRFWAS